MIDRRRRDQRRLRPRHGRDRLYESLRSDARAGERRGHRRAVRGATIGEFPCWRTTAPATTGRGLRAAVVFSRRLQPRAHLPRRRDHEVLGLAMPDNVVGGAPHDARGRRDGLQLWQLQLQVTDTRWCVHRRCRRSRAPARPACCSSPSRRSTSRTSTPGDGAAQFEPWLARRRRICDLPDLIAVEEIQDNNGATDDGTVDARLTFAMFRLRRSTTAGGLTYRVSPHRVGERPGRRRAGRQHPAGVSSSAPTAASRSSIRPEASSTTPTTVVGTGGAPSVLGQPGRIDPTNAGLQHQPQAARRRVHLQRAHAVRHRESLQLEGWRPAALRPRFQPPTLSSETQRLQQATSSTASCPARSSPSTRTRPSSCSATSTTSSSRIR